MVCRHGLVPRAEARLAKLAAIWYAGVVVAEDGSTATGMHGLPTVVRSSVPSSTLVAIAATC